MLIKNYSYFTKVIKIHRDRTIKIEWPNTSSGTCIGEGADLHQSNDFVRDAPGVEVIQPGEEELKRKTAKHFNDLQSLQFQQTHHCMRATHLKTQGVRLFGNLRLRFFSSSHCSASKESLRSTTSYLIIWHKACSRNLVSTMSLCGIPLCRSLS